MKNECQIGDMFFKNSEIISKLLYKRELESLKRELVVLGCYKEPKSEDLARWEIERLERERVMVERNSRVQDVHRKAAENLREAVGGWESEYDAEEAARILTENFLV